MKLVIIKTISISLLLSILLFSGCTKDTVVGPTGPIGATGPTGPAGNANVESYAFVALPSSWNQLPNGTWQATYAGLTLNTNYAISVSMATGNTNTAMPYANSTTDVYYGYSWDLSHIYINVYTVPSTTTIPNPGAQTFNIIIIP